MMFERLRQACSGALRLVMFDLDGTLVDSLPDLHASCAAMLQDLGHPAPSAEAVSTWVGNGARQLVARALSGSRTVNPTLTEAEIETALALFNAHYRVMNGQYSRTYPGATELLSALHDASICTAIVTNKPLEFSETLCIQLALPCDLLLGGDSLSTMKPDPAPLHHCLHKFGVGHDEAVMVGDSVNDLAAAGAAGVAAVAVSYGYNHGLPLPAEDAVCVIDSLQELR